MQNHNNLFLSIGSLIGAVALRVMAFLISSPVMGFLGFIAMIVSIVAGVLTIKDRVLSIRERKVNVAEKLSSIERNKKHNRF